MPAIDESARIAMTGEGRRGTLNPVRRTCRDAAYLNWFLPVKVLGRAGPAGPGVRHYSWCNIRLVMIA